MIKLIKNFFYKIMSTLAIGMKGGDEVLTSSRENLSNGTTIAQKIMNKNVLQALLNGEITQEVEELRYSLYKIAEESKKYDYIGNGVAKKSAKNIEAKIFTQSNIELVDSTNDAIKTLTSISPIAGFEYRKHLINIKYNNPNVLFKLESYIEKINVNAESNIIKLFIPNFTESRFHKPIINRLQEIIDKLNSIDKDSSKSLKARNKFIKNTELLSSLDKIEFITTNASNNIVDGLKYTISKPSFQSISLENGFYVITFKVSEIKSEGKLSEKYYSKEMDYKYSVNEKRANTIDMDRLFGK